MLHHLKAALLGSTAILLLQHPVEEMEVYGTIVPRWRGSLSGWIAPIRIHRREFA